MKAIPCARYITVNGIVRLKNQAYQDHASVGQIASAAARSPCHWVGAACQGGAWRALSTESELKHQQYAGADAPSALGGNTGPDDQSRAHSGAALFAGFVDATNPCSERY